MKSYSEHNDRFEKTLLIGGEEVVISIDKSIAAEKLGEFDILIERECKNLLSKSIGFIERSKADRGINYIDDLTDPQIMLGSECISLYWYSEKGELQGESTVGVDFEIESLEIVDLTISD